MAVLGENVKKLRSREERGAAGRKGSVTRRLEQLKTMKADKLQFAKDEAGLSMTAALAFFALATICPVTAGVSQLGWVPIVHGGMNLARSGEAAADYLFPDNRHDAEIAALEAQLQQIHSPWKSHKSAG